MAIANNDHTYAQQISASLAVSCFVAITQLTTKETISTSLSVSVLFFSMALPLLVAMIFIKPNLKEKIWHIGFWVSHLLSMAGFTCIFFSFHWLYGILFIIFSILGLSLFGKFNGQNTAAN
jgi:hypothetical protein